MAASCQPNGEKKILGGYFILLFVVPDPVKKRQQGAAERASCRSGGLAQLAGLSPKGSSGLSAQPFFLKAVSVFEQPAVIGNRCWLCSASLFAWRGCLLTGKGAAVSSPTGHLWVLVNLSRNCPGQTSCHETQGTQCLPVSYNFCLSVQTIWCPSPPLPAAPPPQKFSCFPLLKVTLEESIPLSLYLSHVLPCVFMHYSLVLPQHLMGKRAQDILTNTGIVNSQGSDSGLVSR